MHINKIIPFFCMLLICGACKNTSSNLAAAVELYGRTMGTTYTIKYLDEEKRNFQEEIDELLKLLNLEVSTYIPNSTISTFNRSTEGISLNYAPVGEGTNENLHFLSNFNYALKASQITEGALQPTLMPLINYWGFGYTEKRAVTAIDSFKVDSLLAYVGLDKIAIEGDSLKKLAAGVQLDFSALAKGYGADLVGQFLTEMGIQNYFIEIGGDGLAKGKNAKGNNWRVGINVPKPEAGRFDFADTAPLIDQAIATSGNYRNYYEVDGEKYGHTINPYTGYPEKNNLLSVTVFAPRGMEADALATAFMVLGPELAMEKAESLEDIQAYFIIGKADGSMETNYTSGLNSIFGE